MTADQNRPDATDPSEQAKPERPDQQPQPSQASAAAAQGPRAQAPLRHLTDHPPQAELRSSGAVSVRKAG